MCIIHTRNYFKSKRKSWSSGKTIITSFTKAVESIWTSLMTKPEKTSCFASSAVGGTCGARSSSLISHPDRHKDCMDPSQRKSESQTYAFENRSIYLALSRTVSICWLPLVRSDLHVWRQSFRITLWTGIQRGVHAPNQTQIIWNNLLRNQLRCSRASQSLDSIQCVWERGLYSLHLDVEPLAFI